MLNLDTRRCQGGGGKKAGCFRRPLSAARSVAFNFSSTPPTLSLFTHHSPLPNLPSVNNNPHSFNPFKPSKSNRRAYHLRSRSLIQFKISINFAYLAGFFDSTSRLFFTSRLLRSKRAYGTLYFTNLFLVLSFRPSPTTCSSVRNPRYSSSPSLSSQYASPPLLATEPWPTG